MNEYLNNFLHVNYHYFRLGGVPLGVVCVETRTVELSIPADPANVDSEAKVSVSCFYTSVYVVCTSLSNIFSVLFMKWAQVVTRDIKFQH